MKIYTKVGDKGTTRLVDGSCVDKFNPRVVAYGSVDELNSHLGLLIHSLAESHSDKKNYATELTTIQHHLFRIGSLLATEDESVLTKLPEITANHSSWLETLIDEISAELPPLKNFILPQGHLQSVYSHLCRTQCRKAERETIAATVNNADTYQHVRIYLNRLSDLFFVLSRLYNYRHHVPETAWDKER